MEGDQMQYVCQHYGKSFQNHRQGVQSCSRACRGKAQTAAAQVELQCYTCRKSFQRTRSRIRGKYVQYCSEQCERKRPPEDIAIRFWKLVDRRGPDECWPWQGATGKFGHGVFRLRAKKACPAHVMAWELTYGPMPEGMQGNHTCDNAWCCNPKHCYPGTQQENMEDLLYAEKRAGRKAVLSDSSINEIEQLLNRMPQIEIASMFHISPSVVSAIRHKYYKRPKYPITDRPDRSDRIPKVQLRLPL
jgi:hypothetical protein